jgi:uncharacterized membrane-anchored protein
MKKKVLLVLYSLTIAAQLAVPGLMIQSVEDVLNSGTRYRFTTEPIDPVDAFRGRYVELRFTAESCTCGTGERFKEGTTAFAALANDSGGFAHVSRLSHRRPETGDFFKVKVNRAGEGNASITFPFDKFFVDEDLAPRVETLYREHNLRGKQDSYAVVRVKNGRAVMEDLIVGGLPVREAAKKARE